MPGTVRQMDPVRRWLAGPGSPAGRAGARTLEPEAMSMTTSWRPAGRGPVPEPDPARQLAAADLRAALEDVSPPDDEFGLYLAAAVLLLRSEVLAAPGLVPRPDPARLS